MTQHAIIEALEARIRVLEGRLADSEAAVARLRTELEETHSQYELQLQTLNQRVVDGELVEIELNQTFNTSADGMWVVDDDFRVQRVNDALLALLGKPKAAVIGRRCHDLLGGSVCRSGACPMVRLKRSNSRYECDMERSCGCGEKNPCYILSATPFLGLDGKMMGIVESVKDITSRKAVERALHEANEELARQATIDGLTGISNRRRFDESLVLEWRRMVREGGPLSLIMCDIDFFKHYNDTYGHLEGDSCLKAVAAAIAAALLRPGDLVTRYGGEEFAVLLPSTPADGVMLLAERIQAAVTALDIPHATSAAASFVTLSMGAATMIPERNDAPDRLVRTADGALYDAKAQGRNRVVFKPCAPLAAEAAAACG